MAPRHGNLYSMAKKKHGDPVGSGRLMWAAGGGSRLWDRDGLEWQDADKEVDRAEAERMLRSADVPFVISIGSCRRSRQVPMLEQENVGSSVCMRQRGGTREAEATVDIA